MLCYAMQAYESEREQKGNQGAVAFDVGHGR